MGPGRCPDATDFQIQIVCGCCWACGLVGNACRVSTEDYSPVLLTEPDMRARIRLFGSIDQNASDSWGDTCGWLISFQRAVSEAIRPVNQDGG